MLDNYPEIKTCETPYKIIYLNIMLWFVGRSISAAAKIDPAVKKEFNALKENFLFCMRVKPNGPAMYVGKTPAGKIKYFGRRMIDGRKPDVDMIFKTMDGAMRVFTFRESTMRAACSNRIILFGEIPEGCTVIRILNIVEVYLLPKIIAKLAVRRYPSLSQMNPLRIISGRVIIYILALLGL